MFNDFLFYLIRLPGRNFNDFAILFIALISVCCYINYDLVKLAGIKSGLRRLNGEINMFEGYGIGNIKKLDELFVNRINSAVRKAWEACYDDYRHIMIKEKMPDIKEYFNLYGIITIPAGRKRAETVPGILISFGILGTILSIMADLTHLTSALNTIDAMNSLLSSIAYSFSISIVALILSILFQLFDRQLYHSTVSELNLFLSLVTRKIPMASDSSSLEMLVKEQRGQTEALHQLGADISAQLSAFVGKELVPSIYKSFDTAIKSQIAPSIKEMGAMLAKLSEMARETQTSGVQTMVDCFTDKLMSTMGLQFGKLGESILDILEYQTRREENVSMFLKELSNNAELQKNVNTETAKVLEAIRCYQQQSVEMNTALAGNMDSMKQFNETLREILESDNKSVEELNSQRKALQEENSEYFGKMDDQIRRLLEELSMQLDASFSRFNDITALAFERLSGSMNAAVEGVSSNMKTLADNMDDQVRDISIYAKGLSEEVGELNSRLENAVDEFANQMNAGVVKTMDTFDNGLSEVCGRFGRVISDLKDAVEDLPAVIEAMGNYKAEEAMGSYKADEAMGNYKAEEAMSNYKADEAMGNYKADE